MKTKLVFMVASVLFVSAPLFAHHGRVGYDNKKVLTLKAKVTEFDWTNPHVQILFDAPDEKGVMQHWDVEGTNPFGASRAGWTKNSFKPGDQITITFHPAANGLGVGLFMGAVTASGQKLGAGTNGGNDSNQSQ